MLDVRWIAATLLFSILAGCATSKDDPGNAPPTDNPPAMRKLAFNSVVVDTRYGATEPSILVDPAGTIWIAGPTGFVTPAAEGNPEPYTHDSGLFSSKDGGKTWTFNAPIPGYGRDTCPGGGDSDIAASPDGTLFLLDLYLANVVVDVSSDGGETWVCNPYTSAVPGDDRQWVEVFKNDAVYIMFNQIPTGIIVLKASRMGLPTDGLVYTQQTPVNGQSDGNFAVDQTDGTIYLAGSGTTIYVSTDGGASFSPKGTTLEGLHDFRTVTLDGKGTVYVVGATDDGVVAAWSKDKGETWSKPSKVGPYKGDYNFPWSVAGGDGVLNVAWYGRPETAPAGGAGYYLYFAQTLDILEHPEGGATFESLNITSKPVLTTDICMGLGCGPGRALGDFFEIGLDHDGSAVVAYNDGTQGDVPVLLFAKQVAGPKAA
jgi:hypothetical protein